jgi:hypothetical protein
MNELDMLKKTIADETEYNHKLLLRIKELSDENAELKKKIINLEKKKGF